MVICMWYTMVSAYELQEEQVLGGSGSVFKIYLYLIFSKKKISIIRRPLTRLRVFFQRRNNEERMFAEIAPQSRQLTDVCRRKSVQQPVIILHSM